MSGKQAIRLLLPSVVKCNIDEFETRDAAALTGTAKRSYRHPECGQRKNPFAVACLHGLALPVTP